MTGSVLSTVLSERNTYVALCTLYYFQYTSVHTECVWYMCMISKYMNIIGVGSF